MSTVTKDRQSPGGDHRDAGLPGQGATVNLRFQNSQAPRPPAPFATSSLSRGPPRAPGSGVFADADVVFEALVGRIERFPDGHRQIGAGLTINGDSGVRNAERDPHPEPAPFHLGPRSIDGDSALLDPFEEM